jgi:hypothetical protein
MSDDVFHGGHPTAARGWRASSQTKPQGAPRSPRVRTFRGRTHSLAPTLGALAYGAGLCRRAPSCIMGALDVEIIATRLPSAGVR